MTENEKIGLFDKWYDENYDEWAEGEEGIALREELEQAFKGGIAELEKENRELTDELKALRESIKDYGAGCYENGLRNGKRKLEAQIAELEHENKVLAQNLEDTEIVNKALEKENAELKEELKDANKKVVHLACNQNKDLKRKINKAKELLNEFMRISKASDEDFEHDYSELIAEAEQFISEVEKC